MGQLIFGHIDKEHGRDPHSTLIVRGPPPHFPVPLTTDH